MKSIKNKVVLSYFFIVVITLTIFVGVFLIYTKNNAKNNARKELDILAEGIESILYQNDEKIGLVELMEIRLAFIQNPHMEERVVYFDQEKKPILINMTSEELKKYLQIALITREKLDKGKTQFHFQLQDDTEYFGASYELELKENLYTNVKWIVLFVPLEEIVIEKEIINTILISIIFSFIISFLVSLFLTNRIVTPIKKISQFAVDIANRKFDNVVVLKTGDELEKLSYDIKSMAQKLKDYDMKQNIFLQNSSHELKTPLMSIKGYAEGIIDGVFDDEEKALNIIIDEAERLHTLVQNMIYISKLQNIEDYYTFEEISLEDTLKSSIEKIRTLALERNIEIMYNNKCKELKIKGDREKLIQAFINILSNSIRYADKKIEIEVICKEKSVCIEFTDDGKGFEKGEEEKVFERMYKGEKGNHGLGLSITKIIIEKHNGKIKAKNTYKGAKITIKFDNTRR